MRLEYTEQAQEVLAVMEETAHQMKFSYIGTEHLLYGMLSCPWVTAWKILAENGADESFVLKYLEQNSGTKKIKTLVYSDKLDGSQFKENLCGHISGTWYGYDTGKTGAWRIKQPKEQEEILISDFGAIQP